MDVLKRLFEQHFHSPVERVQPLQGQLGGSGRKIIRLSTGKLSAIGILYDVREENVAFLEFSRHFRRHGLPVPEIYAEDLDHGAYLEEDLGGTTLFEFLSEHRNGADIAPEAVEAYRKVVAVLPRFQVEAGRDLNYKVCYPRASFDRQSIAWDLNYFKYYFLRLAGIPFNEQALEDDFSRLTKFLLSAGRDYFLYRDFQSRNIMLRKVPSEAEPFFLDYQGGRKGALQYDIASLLYDAKADLPPELRQQLLDHYLDEPRRFPRSRSRRVHAVLLCLRLRPHHAGAGRLWLSRLLRAQGAFPAKRALRAEKPALAAAQRRVAHRAADADGSLQKHGGLGEAARPRLPNRKNLTVRIFSFSFHRGLPQDETGNGGGFVFDGRSLPNPGREERFKALTGKDAPVIDYLNQQESVHQFLASVMSLVDASVSNYQRRGFKNLMVSFGCTGGQHRSVYLAEQLAKHLRGKDGVEVVVRHREQEQLNQNEER